MSCSSEKAKSIPPSVVGSGNQLEGGGSAASSSGGSSGFAFSGSGFGSSGFGSSGFDSSALASSGFASSGFSSAAAGFFQPAGSCFGQTDGPWVAARPRRYR